MVCRDYRESISVSVGITCILLSFAYFKAFHNESSLQAQDSLLLKNGIYANTTVPFLCFLQRHTETGNEVYQKHLCGCTIIDKSFVLTAAHCVQLPKNEIRILIGLNSFLSYNVESVKKHAAYIAFEGHDIALLKVVREIDMDWKAVGKVDLSNEDVSINENILLISTSHSQIVMFRTVPAKACYHRIKTLLLNTQFCAVSVDNQTVTEGDSGSPIVNMKLQKLIGILSFGRKVRHLHDFYVFTKIQYYSDWIHEQMKI